MLQTLKAMTARYNRYMTYIGRQRAREVLLQCSDRLLKDTGISRELLEQGVSAWPWQATGARSTVQTVAHTPMLAKQAVKELTAYSDRELHDLGITRGTITECVINGRHGIDHQDERRVA